MPGHSSDGTGRPLSATPWGQRWHSVAGARAEERPFSGREGETLSPEGRDMQVEDAQADGNPATQILCVARSAGHDSKGREQDSASARLLDWGWVDTETKPDKQAEKSYMVQGY